MNIFTNFHPLCFYGHIPCDISHAHQLPGFDLGFKGGFGSWQCTMSRRQCTSATFCDLLKNFIRRMKP
jgi:hypothetical protein